MSLSRIFRIPKPKTFLYVMSLRTGTELINLCLLINKLTGLYGLLAILSGFHLSGMQMSMYIYSLGALALGCHLSPHIRRGASSPLQIVALAWLHVIDAVVNALYTAAFAVAWFIVLARHQQTSAPPPSTPVGDKMMGDAAGFNDPSYNVSAVEVVLTSPAAGSANLPPAQSGALVGHDRLAGHAANHGLASLLPDGSASSIVTICVLWLFRAYFILVVLAYARASLRQHIVAVSQSTTGYAPSASQADNGALYAEDPFATMSGWPGWLGRTMIRFGRGYWLGVEPGEVRTDNREQSSSQWASFSAKYQHRKGSQSVDMGLAGPFERERRRRAGTGPPLLRPIELDNVR